MVTNKASSSTSIGQITGITKNAELFLFSHTLVFQLEDTVCLFGTLLLLDPIHFPKSEQCLLIGSICQNGALLGASL